MCTAMARDHLGDSRGSGHCIRGRAHRGEGQAVQNPVMSRCVLFFFSSRRRHTRFDCDWSSDVCSSDLSRTVRPWEFLPVTGTRAALFGNETGKMEAWVYPLKLFREFHLNFLTEGRVLPDRKSVV